LEFQQEANKQNGVPKTVSKAQDFGFSIGGPIGKPGGNNKLFFFFADEFNPATGGGAQQTFRLPTAPERAGASPSPRTNWEIRVRISRIRSRAACAR
jgi:hypothetical protein